MLRREVQHFGQRALVLPCTFLFRAAQVTRKAAGAVEGRYVIVYQLYIVSGF